MKYAIVFLAALLVVAISVEKANGRAVRQRRASNEMEAQISRAISNAANNELETLLSQDLTDEELHKILKESRIRKPCWFLCVGK